MVEGFVKKDLHKAVLSPFGFIGNFMPWYLHVDPEDDALLVRVSNFKWPFRGQEQVFTLFSGPKTSWLMDTIRHPLGWVNTVKQC